MYLKKINGRNNLCIYKKASNPAEQEYNDRNEIIDNQQVLIVGTAGSGKSVLLNVTAYELWQHGYTIVYLTEKPSREFDNAFFVFKPEEPYHLNILKNQQEEPLDLGDCVIRYHPLIFPNKTDKRFSFNFYKKTAPFKFFSFDIRKIDNTGWASIFTSEEDKEAVRIAIDVCKDLKEGEGLWDFLYKCISTYEGKKIKKDIDIFSALPQYN